MSTCERPNCNKSQKSKNIDLCDMHYSRKRVGSNMDSPPLVSAKRGSRSHWSTTDRDRWKKYRVTPEKFWRMGNTCYSCDSRDGLNIDHDHETGKVRGLLCNRCNTALGLLGEDPDRLARLSSYIEDFC